MRKKFIASILLILSFLLTSCTNYEEAHQSATATATNEVSATTSADALHNIKLNLYFYTNSTNNFTRESRIVKREGNEPLAEIALNELFKGPNDGNGAVPLAKNISLKSLEITQDTVNVYLNEGSFDGLDSLEQVKARFAIYYTLKDIEGIQYVNVYVGDSEPGYKYKPFGTLKKYNIDEYKSEFLNGIAATQQTVQKRNVTLYFADITGKYLLPEVRTITISDNSYVISIVNELISGPIDRTVAKGILTTDCGVTTANIDTTGGIRTLILRFKNLPKLAVTSGLKSENLTYASIVYSVTGFLVDIDRVVIYSGNSIVYAQTTSNTKTMYHTREMYSEYLGSQIALYYPDSTKKQLYKVMRAVYNGNAQDPYFLLTELFKGPNEDETNLAWPMLPQGITSSDILSVKIMGNTAYADFSENFYNVLEQNKGNEFTTAFSIVNTLCELPGVKKVQFLMNGQKRNVLADKIKILDPIYPDYGIINSTY